MTVRRPMMTCVRLDLVFVIFFGLGSRFKRLWCGFGNMGVGGVPRGPKIGPAFQDLATFCS